MYVSATSRLRNLPPVEYLQSKMSRYASTLEAAVTQRTGELLLERQKCDARLAQLLPAFVAAKLRSHHPFYPEDYDSVTICFSQADDFALRTKDASRLEVLAIVAEIQDMVESFATSFAVLKIDAVKDCSVVASGIPERESLNHAAEMCLMAIAHRERIQESSLVMPHTAIMWGVHTAGVVGQKVPRYLLFGDTVNVASRMMTHGQSGAIHLRSKTALHLQGVSSFQCARRGAIAIKGRGNWVTYWLESSPSGGTFRRMEECAQAQCD